MTALLAGCGLMILMDEDERCDFVTFRLGSVARFADASIDKTKKWISVVDCNVTRPPLSEKAWRDRFVQNVWQISISQHASGPIYSRDAKKVGVINFRNDLVTLYLSAGTFSGILVIHLQR